MARIRKHKTNKHVHKKTKKEGWWTKQKIWTVVLAGLMVFSVFGIMLSAQTEVEEELDYSDYKFEQVRTTDSLLWQTEIDGIKYRFDYHPSDVEAVNFSDELNSILRNAQSMYISLDPYTESIEEMELARFELQNELFNNYQKYAMLGVLNSSPEYAQPVINCLNATEYMPVIEFRETNHTAATLEGNCVIIEANEYSILAMKDRILYSVLGIIE